MIYKVLANSHGYPIQLLGDIYSPKCDGIERGREFKARNLDRERMARKANRMSVYINIESSY